MPFPDYLTSFREVLTAAATRPTALVVWIVTFMVLTLVGFLVGRAMHRRAVVTAVPRETPPGIT